MKKSVGKRGLSPVVASVLLILLVIVLASMIFMWARGFIEERFEKFGNPIEEYCEAVDFRAELIGTELEVSNRGNVDIHHLDIKRFRGGDSEIDSFDLRIDAGDAVREDIVLTMTGGVDATRIVVYPSLIGNVEGDSSNKPYTCTEYGITILNNE